MQQQVHEKRAELRSEIHNYHCIEVQTEKTLFNYQFKIWNISSHGMCLLVKSDSTFLKRVNVGDILTVHYFPSDLSWPPDVHQTKIMHITDAKNDKFKSHCFVGLMIINPAATV